ncbi:bifunctional hydroxymethylpyrimidine kinase/phosphomethylpyrimidine kinase [Bacteroides caecigallinarum]|uniref:bifunctional hydroxymethylpyrimidine kinase/phosphomethylpyrimidine kinase n=1 Tax=Bacteroides caecigallinarum TaxID=1411144 RepID=UPI001959501D|nr:bifunctional hydroxymethylpyrimidine kinase/phosphomethylpyrimidine kinase [Bacteroides caecigallinarum]MBM6882400.1 bifunctional hydroxymethylpyrimidine kinase/phosphomethylpyrimidine kinase [Bacteroides caecigallinarum]
MKKYHTVLTIAGSDCSGGAGIQADIKTISALGCYAASAITAVTVQNTCGVSAIHPIPAEYVKSQIEAVMTDIKPEAVKIGMINDVEIVRAIASSIKTYRPKFVVFDPVMVSTSGCKLIEDKAIEAIKNELIPLSTIITPNLKEAIVLTGDNISHAGSMIEAGRKILNYGCHSVLVKGGHLDGDDMCDVLCINGDSNPYTFTARKIDSHNTHGTGCTLSSAIATNLALGYTLQEAVNRAKEYVYKGILTGKDIHIGNGHGPLNHFHTPVPMHIFAENE